MELAGRKARVPLAPAGARAAVRRFGRSPRTHAVALLPREAYGQEEWVARRRLMVGASELAAVLGVSPYASPYSLWWSKRLGWELAETEPMRVGLLLEPVVGELFAAARPELLVCRAKASLWAHPAFGWLGCSPDFLAVADGEDGPVVEPVEVKTDEGGPGWGKPGTAEVPRHHALQVQQQCAIFGAVRGHVARLARKRLAIYTVPFDPSDLGFAAWAQQARVFLASVKAGAAPDLDGHSATTDTLRRIAGDGLDEDATLYLPPEVAQAYLAALAATRAARQAKKAAENRVRQALGLAGWGLHPATGERVVQRRRYKNPGYTVAPFEVDALYPASSSREAT